MKCKNKRCALESRHDGRCSEQGPCAVANTNPVANAVANKPGNPDSLRVQLWREANRDRYNEREKERMRKKRAGRKPLGIAYG